jgi:hypothetical protein
MRRGIIAVAFCLGVVGACSGSDFSAQGPNAGGEANSSAGEASTSAGSSTKPGVGKGGSANTGGRSVAGEGPSAAGDGNVSSGGDPGSGGSNAGTAGGGPGGTSAAGSNAGTSTGGSSAGGGMGGSGGAPQCSTQQTCTASSKCKVAVCSNGKCIEGNQPDGPLALQVAGDCKTVTCAGGNLTSVVATTDKDDLNECTIDSCDQDGTPHHKANGGVHCANGGGFCSFDGKCETCAMAACPKATACTQPLCVNGTCQSAPRPRGTLCNIDATDADQCDGAGTCVECTDSGGCGECCSCFTGACLPV